MRFDLIQRPQSSDFTISTLKNFYEKLPIAPSDSQRNEQTFGLFFFPASNEEGCRIESTNDREENEGACFKKDFQN